MSLAQFAVACAQVQPRTDSLWKSMAFLARYAHQPLPVLMGMPVTDLLRFTRQVAEILQGESAEHRMTND